MLSEAETREWLTLRLARDLSRARLHALIDAFSSPARVLGASARELQGVRGIDAEAAKFVRDGPPPGALARELELMEAHGARLMTRGCPEYPENLKTSSTPPPLLYVRGELRPEDRYSVALVGARQSTTYGLAMANELAGRLAASGITVVSGFARGIDGASHRAALQAGGRTVAILGCGLAVNYPAGNKGLSDRIASEGRGALLSEYPMMEKPDAFHFPERNRIIATISLGTVVVEAAERSGSLITAREALEENRFVFAVPGDVTRLNSRGTNGLIQQGARLVQRAEDVLYEMRDVLRGYLREEALAALEEREEARDTGGKSGTRRNGETRRRSESFSVGGEEGASEEGAEIVAPQAVHTPLASQKADRKLVLSAEERMVYDLIRHEPQYLDTLAAAINPERISVSRLSAVLLSLELKRAVKQLPGRLYAVFD